MPIITPEPVVSNTSSSVESEDVIQDATYCCCSSSCTTWMHLVCAVGVVEEQLELSRVCGVLRMELSSSLNSPFRDILISPFPSLKSPS